MLATPIVAMLLGLGVSALLQWWAVTVDSGPLSRTSLAVVQIAVVAGTIGNRPVPKSPDAGGWVRIRAQLRNAAWPCIAVVLTVGGLVAAAVLFGDAYGYRFAFETVAAYLVAANLVALSPRLRRAVRSSPTWIFVSLFAIPIGLLAGGFRLPEDSFELGWMFIATAITALTVLHMYKRQVRDWWRRRRQDRG